MGSRLAARMAGIMPLTRPVMTRITVATISDEGVMMRRMSAASVFGDGAVEGDAADREGDEIGEGDAADAADAGDGESFSEELNEDVALARAEGFFDADFAGALLHGDEHDVHEADAGDAKGERAHQGEKNLERDGKNLELVELRCGDWRRGWRRGRWGGSDERRRGFRGWSSRSSGSRRDSRTRCRQCNVVSFRSPMVLKGM